MGRASAFSKQNVGDFYNALLRGFRSRSLTNLGILHHGPFGYLLKSMIGNVQKIQVIREKHLFSI